MTEAKDFPLGQIRATLADTVDVVVSGDFEADYGALSKYQYDSCSETSVFVHLLPPKNIHPALGAEDEDDLPTVSAKQMNCTSSILFTTDETLRLCDVEWPVFEEPMFEILLSRLLHRALGFDLDEHVTSVRDTYHDCD